MQPNKVLTIGGWDPSGAYGTAADMKTFTAHQLHGMAALTVATAQNSQAWLGAHFLPADFVGQQLDAVLSDYGTHAVKTGFLGRVDIIEQVIQKLKEYSVPNIVVDPVLVNNHGRLMFPTEVVDIYREQLLPLAQAITPNLEEARVLLGRDPLDSTADDPSIAQQLHARCGAKHVIVTGVKGESDAQDWWFDGVDTHLLSRPWQETQNVSGSGDTFSAALAAQLANGADMNQAVTAARDFVHQAITRAKEWQLAHGASPTGNIFPHS